MEKYRIYEEINGIFRLVIDNATKELADNYESNNRLIIIKEFEDRDEPYKLMFENYKEKEEKENKNER